MNIIFILKTIKKLEAGLSAVIKNDNNIMTAAKKQYCKDITIAVDDSE